ncbi:MAG: DUF6328 family protein [Acidimicrobiales bacterium]
MSAGTVTHLEELPKDDGGDGKPSRYDRELIELLNELRVVLPGVQVLFAFLLIVPFNDRFDALGEPLRGVYLFALMTSALSCVLFTTPPCFHRLRFRRHDKAQLLRVGNRCAVAGCVALALAMVSSVLLVSDYLFGRTVAVVMTGVIGLVIAGLWWVLPIAFGPDRDG